MPPRFHLFWRSGLKGGLFPDFVVKSSSLCFIERRAAIPSIRKGTLAAVRRARQPVWKTNQSRIDGSQEAGNMHRTRVILGILGLVVAATAAHAAAPTEVTLFGQKYTLERHGLGGKYANGLSVTQASSDDKTTTARFVQGDTPAHDRLYVGCFSPEDASLIYDQFYLLTGADPTGLFNQATSNLTQYFGGAVDFTKGGRIAGITWISDVNTGKKQDLNLALQTYTGDDHLRFYDEDTLSDDYISDAILDLPLLDYGGMDMNQPYTGVEQGSVLPDGNVLFIGRQDPSLNEGPQLGIFDVKNKKFFPVLTNVGPATQSQKIP
jgi:hypothetical protein